MSNVPKSKRQESGFQVIETSRQLKKKMIKLCVKLPKRYTDLILRDAVRDARYVARYARQANSVFATNSHEAQIRIDYWIKAWTTLQALSDDLNDIVDIPSVLRYKKDGKDKGVTITELDELAKLVNEEMQLVKGCLKRDRARYKNFTK